MCTTQRQVTEALTKTCVMEGLGGGPFAGEELWNPIMECCRRDLQRQTLPPPVLIKTQRHYKTFIVYFLVTSDQATQNYVAKLPLRPAESDDWSPQHEYDTLLALSRTSIGSTAWRVPLPVGFGVAPRFLLTRFAPGLSMRALVEPGMRKYASSARLEDSRGLCRRVGKAIQGMQAANRRPCEPAPTAESTLAACKLRLQEIASSHNSSQVNRLCSDLANRLEGLIACTFDTCAPWLDYSHGSHGEFSFQNILVYGDAPLTLIDFEGFAYRHFNEDYAKFRIRLEHSALKPSFARNRLLVCWREFSDTFTDNDIPSAYLILSYLTKVLAHLAWLRTCSRRRNREGYRTRLRDWLWARARLRWLRRFADIQSVGKMSEFLRENL